MVDFYNGHGHGADCRWIVVCSVGSPHIEFTEFNLERGYDYVTLFDGNSTDDGGIIRKFTGRDIADSRGSGSTVVIQFTSDMSIGAHPSPPGTPHQHTSLLKHPCYPPFQPYFFKRGVLTSGLTTAPGAPRKSTYTSLGVLCELVCPDLEFRWGGDAAADGFSAEFSCGASAPPLSAAEVYCARGAEYRTCMARRGCSWSSALRRCGLSGET